MKCLFSHVLPRDASAMPSAEIQKHMRELAISVCLHVCGRERGDGGGGERDKEGEEERGREREIRRVRLEGN